jgi:hypothetical protein
MLSLIVIITAVLLFVLASIIFRLIVRPLWNPYRIRRPYFGPYGYYGYGRGYRRHHFPGGLLAILALVALDRIIGRRW